ncbi:MAG: aminotransferase class I/II-fold pyridoxal phosphate-dependent enzyme [Oscillospiraceae bacterium]|jgi:aminotransferase|nr:aminotransferase class I/II-fold pyridoxal phosphate-dependent enzyme [Oscillospiraceae bacterium]
MSIDYNNVLSDIVKDMKPSGIRKFFDLLENRKDAISLGVGEPDYPTPWHIREAGIRSLDKGFTKYTSNSGLTELRREVSRYLKRRFSLTYNWQTETVISVGGSEAIDLAVRALANPGDEIIIPEPCFVCYEPIAMLANAKAVTIMTKAENQFRLKADELRAAITPRTKILFLTYPNNPTGAIMEREDLEAIAQVLRGTDIMVISDEIYAELTYGKKHFSIANIEDMRERTVVVGGFSKCYSMTGWRLGYAVGPAPIIAQMTKIHQYAIMCAPTTSQYAGIDALKNGDADIEKMCGDYNNRRRFILAGFRRLGLECFEAEGAFYVFPCIKSTGLSSEEFCERLLTSENVAAVPGNAFGESGEGYIRCCYAASLKNIEEALTRIGRFLESLKSGDQEN